ncbi:MAG: beta-glucuronidase [Eubacteriales bacterium]|nr:beta-glucuronidase [Eubacteriales bacterium]
MGEKITLKSTGLAKIRDINPLLVSYNIEFAEVTGGTFWKAYTPEQVAGTEEFVPGETMASMMQIYPPVNLAEANILTLAKAMGPCYIRVSGTWSTTTYMDLKGETGGTPPAGYRAVLTREQWDGVLDFVRAVGGKLLITVSNCEGDHSAHEPWPTDKATELLDYSAAYGVPISAVEFTNEPNGYNMTGTPKGYTQADFGRDQDIFFRFIRENYPDITVVGPSVAFDDIPGTKFHEAAQTELAQTEHFQLYSTASLLAACKEKADVFSYHCYYGISQRGGKIVAPWKAEDALTEKYLDLVETNLRYYIPLRDQYVPGGEIWVTETGDAGGGGHTWACTCMEMVRTADEIGRFVKLTDGILFHNTLASSTYGYLDHATHLPRPSYWVVYLWKQLMGDTVFETGEPIREGAHVFAHSRKDGKPGYAYAVVNNSPSEATVVTLPAEAVVYQLTGESKRATTALLNGKPLTYEPGSGEPMIVGREAATGELELPPVSVTYLVIG